MEVCKLQALSYGASLERRTKCVADALLTQRTVVLAVVASGTNELCSALKAERFSKSP